MLDETPSDRERRTSCWRWLAFYLAWQLWLTIAAPHKIADFPAAPEKVNILVTLPFPPERFHVQLFQTYGRVSGNTRKRR